MQNNLNETLMDIALLEQNLSRLVGSIEIHQMLELAGIFLGVASGVLNNTFMIILFVVFMLVQVFTTPRVVEHEIARGNVYLQRIVGYNLNLRRYIVITTIIALVTGALDTILFILLGIPDPLVWGIVAALLSFVPTIGFWLAAIPPTLLALLEFGPATAFLTLAGILLINGFADNVIKPRYIGDGVDLAPFVVIFSVVFWAMILGPAGAVLGVPLTMLIKSLLFESDDRISWIAHLMGAGKLPAESAPPAQETADSE
jgi:predicted PurR-regulated permease PerM